MIGHRLAIAREHGSLGEDQGIGDPLRNAAAARTDRQPQGLRGAADDAGMKRTRLNRGCARALPILQRLRKARGSREAIAGIGRRRPGYRVVQPARHFGSNRARPVAAGRRRRRQVRRAAVGQSAGEGEV